MDDRDGLSSVSKALTLLEVMSRADRHAVGVSDLAAAAELPKSTTHRLLKELEARGFVGRLGPKYVMGDRFIQLGEAVWRFEYERTRRAAMPTLSWLFERTGATVHLGTLVGAKVLYLEKITGRGGCAIPSRVGARIPASCTALGKAMLAASPDSSVRPVLRAAIPRRTSLSIGDGGALERELDRVRESGIAYDREEAKPGVFCVGAAVRLGDGQMLGVSVGGPARRFASDDYALLVREASVRLSRRLAGA
jgi:DNA-binding IclR family transcriptional regulator